MIYVVCALLTTLVLQSVVNAYVFVKVIEHARSITAADLQAHGYGDSARRVAPITQASAKEQVDLQREIIENGGVFSASNPFGNRKPIGL